MSFRPATDTRAILASDGAAATTAHAWLTREEEAELVRRAKFHADRRAAGKLVEAHAPHLLKSARKYRGYGVSVGDLVAEGQLGLLHALGKFEPERGVRFATYAVHWVRAYMLQHVLRSWSLVTGGSRALHTRWFFKIRRERSRAASLAGAQGIEDVIAERLGLTAEEVRRMLQRLDGRDISLDAEISPHSSARVTDELPSRDNQEVDLFEHELRSDLESAVAGAVAALDPRERYVVECRLMTDAPEPPSLADVGRTLGVSRERARQLEVRAKRKLRSGVLRHGGAAVSDWLSLASGGAARQAQ